VVDKIVLFPNCDLHMVAGQSLPLRLMRQKDHPDPAQHRYLLTTVPFTLDPTTTQCSFDWFRPYDPPGHRLDDQPTLVPGDGAATTATVTKTTPGIYLFQVRVGTKYLVGRLQVHRAVASWWFGNGSISTVKDPISTVQDPIAHAQPSLYAKFSADDTGVDLVGDITGHGYVTLTSSDPTTFTVTADGRLLGLKATTDPKHLPTVNGTWPALGAGNVPSALSVTVVDFATQNHTLESVRTTNVKDFAKRHNMLFLAEGFRQEDKGIFDHMVQQAADEMFTKPRHQPYALLEKSFNVFKIFTPSVENTLTCGFAIKDAASVNVLEGTPMPIEGVVGAPGTYAMIDIMGLVGLPRRNEPTDPDAIRTQWRNQGLPGPDKNLDLQLDRVDDTLIREWRVHRADGILNARDTFFGLHTGSRLGDRNSEISLNAQGQLQAVLRPATDVPGSPDTRAFVRRLYEFYVLQVARPIAVHLDRRRHPPELYSAQGDTNPNSTIARYLSGLTFPTADGVLTIGPEWAANDGVFQRSRGLVAMLCLDDHALAQNVNNKSLFAVSGGLKPTVDFVKKADKLFRDPPSRVKTDADEIISSVAHELAHSFNLDDEYELAGGPGFSVILPDTADLFGDNVTHFNFIHSRTPKTPDDIDPDLVKWLKIPLTFMSSRLTADTQVVAGGLRVPIDPNDVGQWMRARKSFPGLQPGLRAITYTKPPVIQLPQTGVQLTPLTIVDIDRAGAVIVSGPGIPPANPIPAGSLLWFAQSDKVGGTPLLAAEPPVMQFLRDTRRPLNKDTKTDLRNDNKDEPLSIKGFDEPCDSFRVIGVYEGAEHFAAHFYRPAGGCKMRDLHDKDDRGGQFCYVCKWLIVNRVDPGMHALLTDKFYPNSK
jgi:hypothetical protein